MTLTMDGTKLRELTRIQLQSLAKREGVRAIGKTEDIIHRLTQKHPRGVPVSEDDENPSVSSAPPRENVLIKSRTSTPALSPAPETSGGHSKGGPAAQATTPSPSSSTEALEQLLYPEDEFVNIPLATSPESISAHPLEATQSEALPSSPHADPKVSHTPPPNHPSSGGHNGARSATSPLEGPNSDPKGHCEQLWDCYAEYDYPTGSPSHFMVVDALRKFTTLVNTIPTMEARIAENRCLLERTETILERTRPDARELAVTREYLETFLLAKMKTKRELWDGTGKMKKKDRKLRMAWLRAERKTESEKRWKEANELNKKHGLKPVPFSAFAFESDEELIESLQTTPANSESGSSKRSREDVDSDGNADDESQMKRARS